MIRRCPAERCKDSIDGWKLLCRVHWFMLPQQLRDRLTASRFVSARFDGFMREAIATIRDLEDPQAIKILWSGELP